MAIPSAFPTIAIVGKHGDSSSAEDLQQLAAFLEERGHRVVFESATARDLGRTGAQAMTPEQIGAHAQLAIVVGGDGTMLGIARQLAPFRVPLIGVNQGRLGFMTDIASDRMLPVLAEMLDGTRESEQRTLLEGTVLRDGKAIFHGVAFNDVVVARGTGSGMVELRVNVDGHFMYNQRSDGLIVATPTGSTAYALSANGPILHPSVQGLLLVPVAPQTLSNRPIALPDSCTIEIEVTDVRDASAHFDMQTFSELAPGDVVRARRSEDFATLLHPRGYNYFDTLRQKLHWNYMPSEPRVRV